MKLNQFLRLATGTLIATALASAAGISYTCASNVAASTCTYLNGTVAGFYDSTFTNASANIYIQYGTTDLAATSGVHNEVSYSAYAAALAANSSPNALQTSAWASLATNAAPVYGSGNVVLSTALASSLGFTGLYGVDASGVNVCNFGGSGCYAASITITNDPSTAFFYRNGTVTADEYDFYSAVEHETDEVLGTASCVATGGGALSDGCGGNTPSAADLFRYSSNGQLVPAGSLDAAPGQYFSYNGGATNGANGFLYNTIANGEDYGDFISSCPGGPLSVQDAEGCPGTSGLDITNDGGAEINMLNAVGYDLSPSAATPEPRTIVLLGGGLFTIGLGVVRRRKLA
jgi:hypothetical protein